MSRSVIRGCSDVLQPGRYGSVRIGHSRCAAQATMLQNSEITGHAHTERNGRCGTYKEEVAGSNPASPTLEKQHFAGKTLRSTKGVVPHVRSSAATRRSTHRGCGSDPVPKQALQWVGAACLGKRGEFRHNWLRNNRRWIRKQMKDGNEIVDIGPDVARRQVKGASEYYEMERHEILSAGYPFYRWQPQP
jgi:hypothetical protein